MIVLNNQPVNFETDPFANPYIGEIKYKQLVQQGDITQFQFRTTEGFNMENRLENPTFQNNLDGWYQVGVNQLFEWNDGVLYYGQQGGARLASTIQQDKLVIGRKYEVNINVNRSQNGYFEIWLGDNRIGQLTAGVQTVSGVCESTNQFKIKFIPTVSRGNLFTVSVGSIDYVFVSETASQNHIFPIVDTEDNTKVATINAVNDYLNDPFTSTANARTTEKSLTMSLDWQGEGISNGCYRIGVCDADTNTNLQCGTRNPELSNATNSFSDGVSTPRIPNWNTALTGDGVVVVSGAGVLLAGTDTGVGSASIIQTGLKIGVTYDYSVELKNTAGTGVVTIEMGSGTSATITGNGTKTGQLICAGNTTLKIKHTGGALADLVEVGHVRIQAIANDLEIDYYSNPFYLATTHHRTVVINCNNTENVFGLTYQQSLFTPRLRMRGYVAPDDNAYNTQREESETVGGRRDVYYFKRRKSQLLIIENEPEFIHDWLSLLGGHDHAMVANLEYFVTEDEYPPIAWDYWRVMGSTQLPMQLKQQIERKTVTGEVKTAQFIEDADGDGVVGGFLTLDELEIDYDGGTRDGIFIADPSDPTVGIQTPTSTTQDEFEPSN